MAKAIIERPEIVIKNGKPSAVIIDIKKYQELLERLEDVEDLAEINEARKKPLKFRKFEDFLNECKK